MKNKIIILCMLALFVTPASAKKIYKKTNANGDIVYSDEPLNGAEEVILKPLQTYTPNQPLEDNAEASEPEATDDTPQESEVTQKTVASYQIAFSQPANNQAFTADQADVQVTLFLEPLLNEADRIQLYLDSKPYGQLQTASTFVLKGIERGSHELTAKVFPKNGIGEAKGRTKPLTIHIQKTIMKSDSPFKAP